MLDFETQDMRHETQDIRHRIQGIGNETQDTRYKTFSLVSNILCLMSCV